MNFRFSNISPTHRLCLGVAVAVLLAVGWALTEPLRTDVRNHRLGGRKIADLITGRGIAIWLDGLDCYWDYVGSGHGVLTFVAGESGWEVAHCEKKALEAVNAEDVLNATFQQKSSLPSPSPAVTLPIKLVTYDGDIVIVRRQKNTRAIYAIQAVEQKDGRGHFRSRRILPAAGGNGAGSNTVSSSGASR